MKKSILFCFLMFVFCLGYTTSVYADDVTGEATMNDKGYVTKGRAIILDAFNCYYDYTFSNDSGIYLVQHNAVTFTIHSCDTSAMPLEAYYYVTPEILTPWSVTSFNCCNALHTMKEGTFISTNIPIFQLGDNESINNYIQNGDKSGADNATEWRDEFSDEIPLPHNLKVISGVDQFTTSYDYSAGYPLCFNKDVVFSWNQDDVVDALQYDVDVCFYYVEPDLDSKGIKEYNTAFYPIFSGKSYDMRTCVTETFSADMLNSYYGISASKSLSKMTIRVRNKKGGLSSNVVSVTIDFKSKSATANEDAYESDEDVKNEYVDTDVNADASVKPGVSADGSVDVSSMYTYIRDGFGLLGNGGLIALMSQVFLYIPNSIWVIIKFFVSSLVVISLFAFVVKVVF